MTRPTNPTDCDVNVDAKAYGAVIQFPVGMTQDQCNDILRRMFKAGYCKSDWRGHAPTANAFNPDHGSPCWYIP
jgi:hypothetical protein